MTDKEVEDIVSLWKAVKMLSPLLLMTIGGISSLAVYYLREMSRSMKAVCEALVRLDTHIQQHEDRLDRLEQERRDAKW